MVCLAPLISQRHVLLHGAGSPCPKQCATCLQQALRSIETSIFGTFKNAALRSLYRDPESGWQLRSRPHRPSGQRHPYQHGLGERFDRHPGGPSTSKPRRRDRRDDDRLGAAALVQEWPEETESGEPAPRASLILPANEVAGLNTNIWMGGARTGHGTEITLATLSAASFLDLAGDLPRSFRTFSQSWTAFVFPDVEHIPPRYERLQEIVIQLHGAIIGDVDPAPADLYLMCTHGMNRSGLATGLLLRRLGMTGEDAVTRITSTRRGSLANNRFRQLIHEA